jgi:hypothetical protein
MLKMVRRHRPRFRRRFVMMQRFERFHACGASCRWAMAALVIATLACAGCASSKRTTMRHQSGAGTSNAHESLVLPTASMLSGPADTLGMHEPGAPWEFGRNDAAINYRPYGAAYPYGWSETYTRDRFHTFGGRVHEHSRYEIRSYKIR